VNWQKTLVQALCSSKVEPLSVTVLRKEVRVVEDFVYFGAIMHSSVQISFDAELLCIQPCRV